jgi:tRNA(fMet)-specific endonuclease VapC
MFAFDTDHISLLQLRGRPEAARIRARMSRYRDTAFHTPIVCFHEQVSGWNSYISRARDQNDVCRAYHTFQQILTTFAAAQILSFDQDAADTFETFKRQRVRIGTMDLRIAAITASRRMTLLSRNLSDFRQVPGLVVEDWTA